MPSGRGAGKIWAIAHTVCKKRGSPGKACAGPLAEKIAARKPKRKHKR